VRVFFLNTVYIRIEISYECYRWHWTDSVFFRTLSCYNYYKHITHTGKHNTKHSVYSHSQLVIVQSSSSSDKAVCSARHEAMQEDKPVDGLSIESVSINAVLPSRHFSTTTVLPWCCPRYRLWFEPYSTMQRVINFIYVCMYVCHYRCKYITSPLPRYYRGNPL